MIVRRLSEILKTDREIDTPNWTSRRLLLRDDDMGFSLHDTVIRAGTSTPMCYRHHLEAVYCIEGDGEVEVQRTGETHHLGPGTLYALDGHEEHTLRARTALRMVCIFNPALVGNEVHGKDGAYPLLADDGTDRTPTAARRPRSTPGAEDPYASRFSDDWEAAERQDPVVWGEPGSPLGREDLERFDADGYLFRESLFGPGEVEDMLGEASRLAGSVDPQSDEVIAEPDGNAVRSIFRIHRTSDVLRRFCLDPRVVDIARQILGSDVYVHQSRVNFKPGFSGKEFFWHSDFETWHIEDGMPRMRALSVSICLTENNEFNGPLMVVPGSHRTFIRCAGETPDHHYKQSLRRQEYGVPSVDALKFLIDRGRGIEAPKGPAGSVIFFDSNTMHGSVGNLSPFPRTNLFTVFNSVENAVVEPFGGLEPRPEFLAERRPEPVVTA